MPLQTYLDDVLRTQDGPWECYDAVVTASDIAELYRTGFLRVDPDRQRGIDPVSGKQVVDARKIEVWTDELIAGSAIFGELSWNLRRPESEIYYEAEQRRLRIVRGGATIPDSWHRHKAILQACESALRGSGFDLERHFSVRIYHVTAEEEARVFYALNQEGKPADHTRSKWLYPKETSARIAREVVRCSPYLGADNVDTVRDRLSRRNPRLTAFNTLANAIASAWGDVQPADEADVVSYLLEFWNALVEVLPELGRLDLAARRAVRESSLMDSGVAIHAYIRLARRMQTARTPLSVLARLAQGVEGDDGPIAFFSRANPDWVRRGVLIPSPRRDGSVELSLRNARQSFEAMADALTERVGVKTGALGGEPQVHAPGNVTEVSATYSTVSVAPGNPADGESAREARPAARRAVPVSHPAAGPAASQGPTKWASSGPSAELAWRDAALAVLRERAVPMHYRDLYAGVAARGVTFGGRSPEATFLASISRDAGSFVGLGRGVYWIAGETVPSEDSSTVQPTTHRRPPRPKPIGQRRRS